MRICAAGLCVWLRWFVYVCICDQKIDLFSALPFEKILPCVLYYLIMDLNASKMVFYFEQIVQMEQFVLFYLRPVSQEIWTLGNLLLWQFFLRN